MYHYSVSHSQPRTNEPFPLVSFERKSPVSLDVDISRLAIVEGQYGPVLASGLRLTYFSYKYDNRSQ